jgi:hypothetical protein
MRPEAAHALRAALTGELVRTFTRALAGWYTPHPCAALAEWAALRAVNDARATSGHLVRVLTEPALLYEHLCAACTESKATGQVRGAHDVD